MVDGTLEALASAALTVPAEWVPVGLVLLPMFVYVKDLRSFSGLRGPGGRMPVRPDNKEHADRRWAGDRPCVSAIG